MAYGTQVNINGHDMVSIIDPVVYVDIIYSPDSGSRGYNVPAGYSLQYYAGVNLRNEQADVSINGGTLSWSKLSGGVPIIVFFGR